MNLDVDAPDKVAGDLTPAATATKSSARGALWPLAGSPGPDDLGGARQ